MNEGESVGTDLYRSMLAFEYGDQELRELMAKVWSGTPWMVNAYTDSPDSGRWRAMVEWCREQFGPEAWPIHERHGQWHSGNATVHGWTWMGFTTEDQMRRFMQQWAAPRGVRID